jgi:NADH pyrophosphatase NudC (nudix superfamily)
MKQLTLVYLLRENEICLALKKRGFGAGNYNGYGGKVEEGETIQEGAVREVYEESLVRVQESDLAQVAAMTFYLHGEQLQVTAYVTYQWEGVPQETEEMKPKWFTTAAIPYEKMWADDVHWMPRIFAGEKLVGTVWFEKDGKTIAAMEWNPVTSFQIKTE